MIRSHAIRASAEGETCTIRSPWCNGNPATVVWCHSPFQVHGHGTGIKSSDLFGCYGCSACHDALDGRAHAQEVTQEDKLRMYLRANAESVGRLVEKGLIEVAA